MVEQAVENVSRIPNRHVDDFGVEGRVLIGNMGVKSDARITPVTRVYFGRSFSAAPSAIALSIRRGGSSLTPVCRERNSVLIIDEFRERFTVGLISDVPGHEPRELGETCARTGLRHFHQSEID